MAQLTPMMEQYTTIKRQYQDTLLFFRMGDFYEMFFEDAKTASRVLGLTLTSRNHGKKDSTPLAGIPHHAVDTYLAKLIKAGYKVAICEQVEDPKKAKGIVKRDVVEVVTPGTTFSDSVLQSERNNFLASLVRNGKEKDGMLGCAFVDLTTGEFFVFEDVESAVLDLVVSIAPAEMLLSESWDEENPSIDSIKQNLPSLIFSKRDDWNFSHDFAYSALCEHFSTASLKGFGCEDLTVGIAAAGSILKYLQDTQKTSLAHIKYLRLHHKKDFVIIDSFTQKNLELIVNLQDGTSSGTLLASLNKTITPMGGRLLRKWILQPLHDSAAINLRLDAVDELQTNHQKRDNCAECLKKIGDMERLIVKTSCMRANARDLTSLKHSLQEIPAIKKQLNSFFSLTLQRLGKALFDVQPITSLLDRALVENPPLSLNEGGLIKKGYHQNLDELLENSSSAKQWIANLQQEERKRLEIPSLKVEYNKVFGYYIEVTKRHLQKIPQNYLRKQTLVNAERYITPELKEYEDKVLRANEQTTELEYTIFCEIRDIVAQQTTQIQQAAHTIAELDNLIGFAEVSLAHRYTRPSLNEEDQLNIQEGRHPVIEQLLPDGKFVPNDLSIDNKKDQILIITGPNMAGKSTYLRQIGHIVIMAHMGCFVPARKAVIGLVDRIFTRVGASDNLARGESTFLVEMNETAHILNNATPRSLILLDEIGRGTSTFDGLSLAWAITEYLHNTKKVAAKTLFATHYHELTELEQLLPRVKNYTVLVKEFNDTIVFLRKIIKGGCDSSYGVQVARLAGLPEEVINRAKQVLKNLETHELTPLHQSSGNHTGSVKAGNTKQQLNLFFPQVDSKLHTEVRKIDINKTTPVEALNTLNQLKQIVADEEKKQKGN